MPDIDLSAPEAEAKMRLVSSLRGKGAHLTVTDAVTDFPDSLMNEMPPNVPYSFWHQLEHIRICQWDILHYVLDPNHVSPSWPNGYWPNQTESADHHVWEKTLADYSADLEDFVALIERDDTSVLEPVPHNDGRSVMGSALIVIDHTGYHLGEFVMGRQVLGEWKSVLS